MLPCRDIYNIVCMVNLLAVEHEERPCCHEPTDRSACVDLQLTVLSTVKKGAREAQTNTNQQTQQSAATATTTTRQQYRKQVHQEPGETSQYKLSLSAKRSLSARHVKNDSHSKYRYAEACFASGRVLPHIRRSLILFKAQHRATHLLGARRLTQAQSTLFDLCLLGARRPTKHRETEFRLE